MVDPFYSFCDYYNEFTIYIFGIYIGVLFNILILKAISFVLFTFLNDQLTKMIKALSPNLCGK